MSPARCHIEQSRNTLQFSICAKEVATSAQVNVIMSDKALIKHLQKEVARLENEMKYTGLSSLASTSDAFKEKDAQIKKVENKMKSLMKQRDLAQSRLEDLLRTVAYDQASGPWEESSQSSMPCAQLSFDDTSLSDSSVVSYQSLEYSVSHVNSNSKFCGKVEDQQHKITPLCHSSKTIDFTYWDEEISPSTSPDIDIHFKEVKCIRMIKPSMIEVDEFMPLSSENIHSPIAENEEPVEVQVVNKHNFEVETEARKFITLIDELYNHHWCLVSLASSSIYDLFQGTEEIVKEMTNGGADYSFECIGDTRAVLTALQSCCDGWGVTVTLGVPKVNPEVSTHYALLLSARTLKGSLFGGWKPKSDLPSLVDKYMNKEIQVDELVTDDLHEERL